MNLNKAEKETSNHEYRSPKDNSIFTKWNVILVVETGNYPIEYIIMKKQVFHSKRNDSMQTEIRTNDVMKTEHSEWKKDEITESSKTKWRLYPGKAPKDPLDPSTTSKMKWKWTKIKHWKERW